jgi:hypothetical protein
LILLSSDFLVPAWNFLLFFPFFFCVEFCFSHKTPHLCFAAFSVPSLNQTEEDVIALVKQSLRNLQTDYIDL